MNIFFHKSFAALGHPLTLVSLVVLLLNDHLFRILRPSWITGKLGDAAWLFFAPLALLFFFAAFSRLLPGWAKRQNLLPYSAYGLVGGIFILGNTLPGFTAWLAAAGEQSFGFPLHMVCDPGDLLTLPFLAASFLLWKHTPAPVDGGSSRKLAGGLAAVMGAALTLANSAAPQYGVDGLVLSDGRITACSAYEDFASTDGGFTWQVETVDFSDACSEVWDGTLEAEWQGQPLMIRYNKTSGAFESSNGNGSWQSEYVLRPASEAGQALFAREILGNVQFSLEGPFDAEFDPVSGNIIAAMGLEGVLVRTPDAVWQRVAVGEFYPRKVNTLSSFFTLLYGELALALGLSLLLLGSAGAKLQPKLWMILPLVAGWLGWVLILMFRPALYENYPIPLALILIPVAVFIVPVGVLGFVWLVQAGGRSLLFGALMALGGFLFFLAPFLLWALDIIPAYTTAMLIGSSLALVHLLIVLLIIRDKKTSLPDQGHPPG